MKSTITILTLLTIVLLGACAALQNSDKLTVAEKAEKRQNRYRPAVDRHRD